VHYIKEESNFTRTQIASSLFWRSVFILFVIHVVSTFNVLCVETERHQASDVVLHQPQDDVTGQTSVEAELAGLLQQQMHTRQSKITALPISFYLYLLYSLTLDLFKPTQPSIPQGSVNEYQLRLGRQRQVWFIPIADECGVCR